MYLVLRHARVAVGFKVAVGLESAIYKPTGKMEHACREIFSYTHPYKYEQMGYSDQVFVLF